MPHRSRKEGCSVSCTVGTRVGGCTVGRGRLWLFRGLNWVYWWAVQKAGCRVAPKGGYWADKKAGSWVAPKGDHWADKKAVATVVL